MMRAEDSYILNVMCSWVFHSWQKKKKLSSDAARRSWISLFSLSAGKKKTKKPQNKTVEVAANRIWIDSSMDLPAGSQVWELWEVHGFAVFCVFLSWVRSLYRKHFISGRQTVWQADSVEKYLHLRRCTEGVLFSFVLKKSCFLPVCVQQLMF